MFEKNVKHRANDASNNPGSINQQPRQPWLGDQRNLGGPKGCYCSFWSPQNHCSVPQIPFSVPRKQLFCPLKFQIICRPPKIIVLSPQIQFLVALKIILSPQK